MPRIPLSCLRASAQASARVNRKKSGLAVYKFDKSKPANQMIGHRT